MAQLSGVRSYTVDSTVIHVNGVRYRVLHKTAGALNMPDSTRIIASSGVSFRNRYTSLGSSGLTSVVQDGFNSTSFDYDTEGRPVSEINSIGTSRYPNWTALHSLYSQGFNATSLSNSFARKYHYDGVGRIDTEGEDFAGTQQVFHYDAYSQLTEVDNQTGCSAPVGNYTEADGWPLSCTSTPSSTTYTYDNVGNRTDLGATYYTGNRLALFNGGWNTYDADGNLHQKYLIPPNPHNEIFSWNPENRLDTVSTDGYYTVVYKYNALGQPVLKYRQGALDRVWVWDGDQLLLETDGSNSRVGEYQYARTDAPYAVMTGGASPTAIQYQEQDALGNVLGTHDGTTVKETISYDAWGYPAYSGDLTNRLMWKGLMWEGDMVGLYYMRGRWYDPAVGRFIQEDPLGVDGGINVYAFAANDPVDGFDPSGLIPGDGSACQTALDDEYAAGEITGSEDLYGCPGLPPVVILVAAPPGYVPDYLGRGFDGGDLPTGIGPSGGPTGAQAQWIFSDVGRRVITMPKIVNCFSAGVATLGTAALDVDGFSALKAGIKEFFTARAAAAVESRGIERYLGMNARGMQLTRSAGRTAAIQIQFAQADATEVARGVGYGLTGSLPTDEGSWKAVVDAFPGAATFSMAALTRDECK